MASFIKNLSEYDPDAIPDAKNLRIALVVSEWNWEITRALQDGAVKTLLKNKVKENNITVEYVPGSYELCLGAQLVYENNKPDAVICLGVVIQGETRHFDFICDGVTNGIMNLNLKFKAPFIFGVLTPNTYQQAEDRAGGKYGNKGDEAAITAIKMADMSKRLISGIA